MKASIRDVSEAAFAQSPVSEIPGMVSDSSNSSVAPDRSLVGRALALITEIDPKERATALMLALNMFVLLGTYYVLKTVREALILTEGGAEVKSYSAAGQALLLVILVPAYGIVASKFKRGALIAGALLFSILNLFCFYLVGTAGIHIGVAFFLWLGIFSLMVTAQLWAFANDIYDPEQGKRLMPLVGVGSSLGAWAGASLAGRFLKFWDTYQLMLIGAFGLLVCVGLTLAVDRRENRLSNRFGTSRIEKPMGREGGFQLVFKNRYLLLIALLVLVLNVVNTTGEFILGKMVVENANQAVVSGVAATSNMKVLIGEFYSSYFAGVNLLGLLLQLFVVSRIFKYIGVRGALFLLPAIALVGYSLIAVMPLLAIVRLGKTFENSVDYSVQSTARHALFLPTSREAKYKAQSAIESFFWRAGDMLQAAIVFAGSAFAVGIQGYAALNVVLVVIWLLVVIALYREHKKLEPATKPSSPASSGYSTRALAA